MEKLFVGPGINLKKRVGDNFSKRKSAKSREITSSVKRTKDSTAGSLVGEEKKAKERKLNGAGLIVQPVEVRTDQSPAEEKMPPRVERGDVVLLVRPVKLTKEGEEHDELERHITEKTR